MTSTIEATARISTLADTLTVINPATEAVLDRIPCSTRADFASAIERAGQAFQMWRTSEDHRRVALRQCVEVLRKRKNAFELATLLTQEQGKPKREALNEIYAASHWFATLAELALPVEQIATEHGVAKVQHEPIGIVGAITSWNFPIFLAACKIASALLPGNVVVLKPSPFTPLSTLRLAELIAGDAAPLPKGVLTVLVGDRELGGWLLDSAEVGHVSFTGSVHVGRTLLRNSADTLKSTTLELGGNDAAIVLADADVNQIVEPLFWGAFTNAGQFCSGIKRLFVHESIFEPLVAKLAQRARETIVGDGLHPRTQMGPLAHERQFSRVDELVKHTRQGGASIVAGGEPLSGPGYFFPPTIVTDVADADPLVVEEQFGPVLPIMSFTDADHAIARANATDFGLGGSIWTRNEELAADLASRLECGTVWVNRHGVLDPLIPFGGRKTSGIGYENGPAGVSEFTRLKVVHRPTQN